MIEGVEVSTEHWIGGERAGRTDDVRGRLADRRDRSSREVARGGAAEADAAVAAARDGFDGWGATPPAERAAVLHRIADGVEERVAELAAGRDARQRLAAPLARGTR